MDTRDCDPDNVVPYPDQALFLALRGADQEAVMQALWIYDHPIDLDGVKRFHRNFFGRGLLARRIETSPLPFGRHRWVSHRSCDANLRCRRTAAGPRAELYDWADEQVELPLDPESGTGLAAGVSSRSPMARTVVSLVVSHCVADGAAAFIMATACRPAEPRAISATRRRVHERAGAGSCADLRQTSARCTRNRPDAAARRPESPSRAAVNSSRPAAPAPLPAAAGQSNASGCRRHRSSSMSRSGMHCADKLGGNSFSLVAGFRRAARRSI